MNDAVPAFVPADVAVEVCDDAISVDAAIIGQGLGLDPQAVPDLMRRGAITGVCERGVDEDADRYRLTFFHQGRRFRLIVEDNGRVVGRSAIDFGARPLPERLRRTRA